MLFTSCANSGHAGQKRLRSLASTLWDTDGDDGVCDQRVSDCVYCPNCRRLESMKQEFEVECQGLRDTILQLQSEKSILQERIRKLKDDLSAVTLQLFEVQKYVKPLGGKPGARTEPKTQDSWLLDIGVSVDARSVQEFHEEWSRFCSSEITFALCKQDQMNANRIFSHCEWVVHKLGRPHPVVYKVGITENVIDRWCNKPYAYTNDQFEKWDGMVVLFVGPNSLTCALVEAFLIHRFIGRPGCRNCLLGGETAKPGCKIYFTYCVWRSLAPPQK